MRTHTTPAILQPFTPAPEAHLKGIVRSTPATNCCWLPAPGELCAVGEPGATPPCSTAECSCFRSSPNSSLLRPAGEQRRARRGASGALCRALGDVRGDDGCSRRPKRSPAALPTQPTLQPVLLPPPPLGEPRSSPAAADVAGASSASASSPFSHLKSTPNLRTTGRQQAWGRQAVTNLAGQLGEAGRARSVRWRQARTGACPRQHSSTPPRHTSTTSPKSRRARCPWTAARWPRGCRRSGLASRRGGRG